MSDHHAAEGCALQRACTSRGCGGKWPFKVCLGLLTECLTLVVCAPPFMEALQMKHTCMLSALGAVQ